MQDDNLIGKPVKAVFSDQGQEKVIYGTLIEEDEFSFKIKDRQGHIIIIGKRSLIFIRGVESP